MKQKQRAKSAKDQVETMNRCATCGNNKPKDGFRNCEDCRKAWRLQQRRPNGWANKIEKLEQKVKELEQLLKEKMGKYPPTKSKVTITFLDGEARIRNVSG